MEIYAFKSRGTTRMRQRGIISGDAKFLCQYKLMKLSSETELSTISLQHEQTLNSQIVMNRI